MKSELTRQLKGDEGTVPHAYQDHLGFWTIGVGRLIDERRGGGLKPHEIDYLLRNDIDERIDELTRRLPWFQNLDDARRGVLLNMSFQLGVNGLMAFKNTLRFVESGEYESAARNMLLSTWADQTPARSKRRAEQMRTGQWQYAKGT